MANTSLRREVSVTGNRRIFTFSAWFKKASIGAIGNLFSQYVGSGSANIATHFRIRFGTTDNLQVAAGGTDLLITNRLFRDTSSFYHLVIAVDTTQGTADDRVKLYINGVQETSFATRNNPSQNVDTVVNLAGSSHYPRIGADDSDGNGPYGFFDGLMSHVHFVDGTAYAASTFGSTDSTTGEWKINTAPTLTMGTNGFTILKDGNTITDQSANSNNFTLVAGTLTKTEDSPSNVFNVWNRNFLTRHHNESTSIPGMLQNGNATFNSTANAFFGYKAGTLGATSGKWYWEGKIIDNGRMYIGICYPNVVQGINEPHYDNQTYSAVTINNAGEVYGRYTGSAIDEYASSVSFANNDIIGFALDMDNKALYIHKNGTYINSGNPASGASRTGSVIEQLTGTRDSYLGSGDFVSPFVGDPSNSGTFHCENNFGNGFFGTTGITTNSGNGYAGAEGSSIFNYQPPTGYSALSTKGLNQ